MQPLTRTARPAALLIALLVAFFILLSLQVNRGRTLDTARGTVFQIVSPAHRLVTSITSGVGGLWSSYFGLVDAAREAARLRERVGELERRLSGLERAERENIRLRSILGMDEAVTRGHQVARVIGRDIDLRYQSITLDRGSADGVAVDAPVLAPDGSLVGRVVQVARWTSLVQLITDPLAGVGARLVYSRAAGLAAGSNGPELELRYIDTMTEILDDELVVTSGEDGIYPPGLPIGRVVSFEVGPPVPGTPRIPLAREETALFMEIAVRPAVDVTRIEEVLVLHEGGGS